MGGGIRSLQISSSFPLAEGRVDGEQGQCVASPEPGSDSGKPQEVREKDAAAPAGAGKTASNEVPSHASSPPTVPTEERARGPICLSTCLPSNLLAC